MLLRDDHYEVLGLARDASERDVKQAFYRLLRENPPEQKPKEYQRLREAYDVLSDAVARKEYDSMSAFGEEIEALKAEAERILHADEPDHRRAEHLLKKAIVLGPEIGILRSLLGRCYLETEQPGPALRQFERATRINPGNPSYLLDKGHALRDLKRHAEAEAVYRQVWAMDEEDYEAPRALAQLLFERGRRQEAHRVLDRAIEADGQVDFQDFFCLYDKVHFHLFAGEHDALRSQLDVVVRVAKAPADRRFAAFMLARSAASLFDAKAFELANDFVTAAKSLDAESEFVRDLAAVSGEAATLSEGLHAVMEDERYHPLARDLVRLQVGSHLGYIEEGVARAQFAEIAGILGDVMDVDPDAREVKRSLRLLQRERPEVFRVGSDLFGMALGYPTATRFRKPCPHCGEKVTAEKGDYGTGMCPHCRGVLVLLGERFEKTSRSGSASVGSGSSQGAGVPGWIWVVGFFLLMWVMAQC